MTQKYMLVVFFLIAGIFACNKKIIEDSAFDGFQKPTNFPEPTYHFNTNAITKEGFELGRKLFYEPMLSANNTISCGNCHIQTAGFTQHGHSVSHGIFDRLGTRNSPPIMNLAWSKSFMWDGGIFDLDLQPLAPIANHVEMDETLNIVLLKLQNSSIYPSLFNKAFGTSEINSSKFLKALSQYMLMCVSSNSKYDSVSKNQAAFTNDELLGYQIFKQKCNTCHAEPLFTDESYRNNGLVPSSINDLGRYEISLSDTDKYKFKVPSLRNLQYTPPYMHDGRFLTIDAVLNHYSSQMQNTQNIDPIFIANTQLGISLSSLEKNLLLQFLNTLNDKKFITNPILSEQ